MPGAITPTLYISDNPPLNANQGDLWQNQRNGEIQRYDGTKFAALVTVSPQIDGDIFWVENGVTMRLTHAATAPRTITLPDDTGTLAALNLLQNFTALQEFSAGISADGTHTITLPASTGTLALLALAQNWTALQQFSSGISPNGTNTLTLPAITDTLVTKTSNDVLTNKNLTAPTVTGAASITSTGTTDLSGATATTGLKIPTTGGAAPTADGQIAFDSTTHQVVAGENGSTRVLASPIIPMTSFTNVSANTTTFAGIQSTGTEALVALPVPYPITITKLFAASAAVASAGQSFTYTLRKNGVDTNLTCSISGASATSANDTAHTATYAAGDTIDVKIVTSASAAVTAHNFMVAA